MGGGAFRPTVPYSAWGGGSSQPHQTPVFSLELNYQKLQCIKLCSVTWEQKQIYC